MGIELPTPYPGGNGSPESKGSHGAFDARGTEAPRPSHEGLQNTQNVEKNSSNYEPSQEVINGAGTTDNSGQPVYVVAHDTTMPQAVSASPVLEDVPVVAADEDLIEKVWVDAVKAAVTRTTNDPYARSAAIGKLQADYLQKRYGKTLGSEQGSN